MVQEKYGCWVKVGATSPRTKANQIIRFYNVDTNERIWLETNSRYGVLNLWMLKALTESATLSDLPAKLWGRITAHDVPDNRLTHPYADAEADAKTIQIAKR